VKATWQCRVCDISEDKASAISEPLFWVSQNAGPPKAICRSCLKEGIRNNWDGLYEQDNLPDSVIGGVMMELFSERG